MQTNRYLIASLAAVLGFGGYLAYAGGGAGQVQQLDHHDEKATKDIVDIAVSVPDVSTLVTALKAAGLVETLKGDGPFTVFAPTNEAFAKLPPGTVENLLKPENKEQLKKVLLYHVHVGAGVKAADVKTMKLSTAAGQDLDVKADAAGVTVDNAKVIKADVVAKNGVIHLIDTVVMPK
jgi:uncharacterized surface protein with fasciclin (FAS1) repeats